ncbi:unnamed protein product [Cuscuta epithymum]|uniref:At1g61320/AtMIF1 LRR domain-containing protein n=1 Tax=Cuscuta epithymum TaxID=186058 RepID=A0AAV0C9T6_9ASTE|nr:unnamed protein product [Cuscuta epithymum]CAH9140413.1 unnamed protein product [Cuscuta epithymum]
MSEKSLAEETQTQESGESDLGKGEEFGASLEIYSQENVRENRRTSIDRISALPDCLLVHIISFLGLKKAAATSILGKRWQFLWTELRNLGFEFYGWGESKEAKNAIDFVAWVNGIISTHRGNYLEKMTVDFKFEDCFAQDVDNWLQFALKNKVKELRWNMGYNEDCYILREMIYSNSSLTSLSLNHCILVPERTIQWSSLTKLEISRVNLPQPLVEKILSGCPVLTSLDLSECWGFTCLEINSQNLCKLMVTDPLIENNGASLHISAPYIKYLSLSLDPIGRKIKIRDISSLVTAHFNFIDNSWDFILPEDMLRSTKEFFEQIYNVKELDLGPEPLKALAALVLNGWQLPKYKLRCLNIGLLCDAGQVIPGILNVLESSPDIETLVIDSYEPEDLDSNWAPPAKDDLDCDLLHLKTIKMIKLVDPELDGEPMLTLARILLKRTPVLEEMDIYVKIEDADVFVKIGQTLLSYPRSSPKAVIDLY